MKYAIMSIGNEMLMDDGAGPVTARYIAERYEVPENVDVIDRAVMGLGIMADLRKYDYICVVDAVCVDAPDIKGGTIFSFTPEEMASTQTVMVSAHDMRFADVLVSASLLGVECDGHCFGVQAVNASPSQFYFGLSEEVEAAVPLLAKSVIMLLQSKGLEIVDKFAEADSLRAGSGNAHARDFSGKNGDSTEKARKLAEYLEAALMAVGAQGVVRDGGVVSFAAPDTSQDNLFKLGHTDGQSIAVVSDDMTDYDCDGLIGYVRDLVMSDCPR